MCSIRLKYISSTEAANVCNPVVLLQHMLVTDMKKDLTWYS